MLKILYTMNSTNSNMQRYYDFLQDKEIQTYEQLKEIVQNEQLKLKVKEDKKEPLSIIYNDAESNTQEEIVRFFNGVVINRETLKIVCYSFDKCKEDDVFDETLDVNNLYIEPTYEGTLIRVYYTNETWHISTKKMINAMNARWISKKSFGQLFLELFDEALFNHLNKNYCYSFLMSHVDNSVVIKYSNNFLIHLCTVDLVENREVEVDIGISKNNRVKIDTINHFEELKNNENSTEIGFMLIDMNYKRQKINKKIYIKYRDLWGNTNNRLYRYLHLRRHYSLLMEYLDYFKDDKDTFLKYEHYLINISNFILDVYRSRHVSKTIQKLPFYLRDIIYKIHGMYLASKNKVVFQDVNVLLYELDEKKFCYIINNIEKDMKKKNNREMETSEQS